MESSPLTQQNVPDAFHEPKIVQLYLYLFNVLPNEGEELLPSEGFWHELWLLPPSTDQLKQLLDPLAAYEVQHMQTQTRAFFQRAIVEVGSGIAPRQENALENLTGFLTAVLAKRYTNPSADIIEVLAGLDSIDKLVSDLVNGLDAIIRQTSRPEVRTKAVETALALVSGAYQTTLVSYFIHRDLFPALMRVGSSQGKYVVSSPTRQSSIDMEDHDDSESLVLLGLLANYNKFETQNPYQNRFEDFVNESVLHRLARNVSAVCRTIRDSYIAVQDDMPGGWTLNSTLAFVGLRALSPKPETRKAPLTEDEMKDRFNSLPPIDAMISLPIYSFVHANKLFASALATLPPDPKTHETPFSAFLSATSYIAHHAHRSHRALSHTLLNLLTLRIISEDQLILKRLNTAYPASPIRLARQRPPYLPIVSTPRVPITAILDVAIDAISHNLRRRLDVPLYSLSLGITMRITTHLATNKIRLSHHWSYIWGSLLSLMRFLVQYATDLSSIRGIREELCTPLTCLIAHCLSRGDAFLPDPVSYDDLFYKLVEAGEVVGRFQEVYCPTSTSNTPGSGLASPDAQLYRATNALLTVSSHYASLLGTRKHQSPAAVQKVIKDGYETLELGGDGDDFGSWEKYREGQGVWRSEVKRCVRVVVEDARGLGMR